MRGVFVKFHLKVRLPSLPRLDFSKPENRARWPKMWASMREFPHHMGLLIPWKKKNIVGLQWRLRDVESRCMQRAVSRHGGHFAQWNDGKASGHPDATAESPHVSLPQQPYRRVPCRAANGALPQPSTPARQGTTFLPTEGANARDGVGYLPQFQDLKFNENLKVCLGIHSRRLSLRDGGAARFFFRLRVC